MATTKTPTRRAAPKRATTAKTTSAAKPRAAKTTKASATPRTTAAKTDTSIVARTGRTIKERPYTSAAIATGAVTAVAAAAGAAYLLTRKDKSFKEASNELTTKVKDGLASASETVKDGFATVSGKVKDLGQRGSDYLKGNSEIASTSDNARTQAEIAEEALTLKQTGATPSPVDALSATEIKTGAIAY